MARTASYVFFKNVFQALGKTSGDNQRAEENREDSMFQELGHVTCLQSWKHFGNASTCQDMGGWGRMGKLLRRNQPRKDA